MPSADVAPAPPSDGDGALLVIGLGPLDALLAEPSGLADLARLRAALEATPVLARDGGLGAQGAALPEGATGNFGRLWPARALLCWVQLALARREGRPFAQGRTVLTTTDGEAQVWLGVRFEEASATVALRRADVAAERLRQLDHEVSQPLAAVATDTAAAQRWLRRPVPDVEEALAALDRARDETARAAALLKGANRW